MDHFNTRYIFEWRYLSEQVTCIGAYCSIQAKCKVVLRLCYLPTLLQQFQFSFRKSELFRPHEVSSKYIGGFTFQGISLSHGI